MEQSQETVAALGLIPAFFHRELVALRVTDPRSGARLCEAQRLKDAMRDSRNVKTPDDQVLGLDRADPKAYPNLLDLRAA